MINYFFNNLFNFYTNYYRDNDHLKDASGKGLLERVSMSFGEELDSYIGFVEDTIQNHVNPLRALNHHRGLIEADRGNDSLFIHPLLSNDVRALVNMRIHRYWSIRGTYQFYDIMFHLVGFRFSIVEHPLYPYFDSPDTFDSFERNFDNSRRACRSYQIVLERLVNTNTPVTNEELKVIQSIIDTNNPIHTTISTVTVDGVIIL